MRCMRRVVAAALRGSRNLALAEGARDDELRSTTSQADQYCKDSGDVTHCSTTNCIVLCDTYNTYNNAIVPGTLL